MTTRELLHDALALTEHSFANENPRYIKKQKNKILFHTLLNIPFAKKWFSLIQSEEYKWVLSHRPRIYFKPFRVYMSTKWGKKERTKALLSCYAFIKQQPFLTRVIQEEKPIKLAEFTMKYNGEKGQIYLGYNERFRKEGELVVSLHCDSYQEAICEASFVIDKENEGWVCRIGCVQGNKSAETENAIKELQKQMYALRPKALMIFIIQELSRQLGCSVLYGVGSKIQAHNKKHFIHIECLHKLSFSYDTLWKEADGTPDKDGWFKLPIEMHRKPMEEIKSSKRSLYRYRYEMLDKIATEIKETINK
ncbi:VirK/YbjX family protein [Capnocytophaga periodontitidis]|uniref:VirK/YbjX family protein n=1 Tax=Capnocytophaga periodontitidis TaxID=2795027 RepID=UPI0018E15F47|nr:DUF535 family protein [Capnocytophaga periodontitidis]MBI1669550.1 DUF535 family protein [Capnocytophaga periodontitidis]